MDHARTDRRQTAAAARLLTLVLVPLALLATLVGTASVPSTAAQPQSPPGARSAPAATDEPPNIVLLMADDMTYEELEAMPIVRRQLADRGVAFTQAYSPDPSCCPARATVLTGQYAQNHGVYTNRVPAGGWGQYRDDESESLPVWLQDAGYTTSWIGKYMNGYPGAEDPATVPVGWDGWHVPVHGVYNYVRSTINHDGTLLRDGQHYQTLAWRDEMLRQVDALVAGAAPYFMTVSFLAPHSGGPSDPDDIDGKDLLGTPYVFRRDRDTWSGRPVLDKPNLREDDVSDKPQYVQNAAPVNWEALAEAREQRREALASVDRAVGSLIRELRSRGELGNTLIVFTSDNGFLLGEHGLLRKSLPYEESVRVPLIVRGPGFAEGSQVATPVSHADLAPTFLDLAAGLATRPQDGVSLFDVLDDPRTWRQREILLQYEHPDSQPRKRMRWVGLRGNRWAYYEYSNGERELYDMRADPFQLENLVEQRLQQRRVRNLHRQLAVQQTCSGPTCKPTATERP